jgi:hypothetical protein
LRSAAGVVACHQSASTGSVRGAITWAQLKSMAITTKATGRAMPTMR